MQEGRTQRNDLRDGAIVYRHVRLGEDFLGEAAKPGPSVGGGGPKNAKAGFSGRAGEWVDIDQTGLFLVPFPVDGKMRSTAPPI